MARYEGYCGSGESRLTAATGLLERVNCNGGFTSAPSEQEQEG
jgi:hypothetical protein